MNLINPDLTTDAFLLQQVAEGSNAAFNALYEKYWEQAYVNAFKRLKDVDQAKDVVQEVFVNIWTRRASRIDNLPAYLNIAVRNQTFKLLEKQSLIHPFYDILENMPSTYQQTDANVLWKEFYKSYEALLVTLPPKRQIIFRLRFHEDLPTKNIAAQLGVSRKTVQNQLGKAIEQLRVSLLNLLTLLIVLFLK